MRPEPTFSRALLAGFAAILLLACIPFAMAGADPAQGGAGGGGGASAMDDLTDATTSGEATGDLLRWNGSAWVNVADVDGVGNELTGYTQAVEANTAGSGTPNALTASESGLVLYATGLSADNYHSLPDATASTVGATYTFVQNDATYYIRIDCASGSSDTIRLSEVVSASEGYVRSNSPGSTLTLTCVAANVWIATEIVGTWSVDL